MEYSGTQVTYSGSSWKTLLMLRNEICFHIDQHMTFIFSEKYQSNYFFRQSSDKIWNNWNIWVNMCQMNNWGRSLSFLWDGPSKNPIHFIEAYNEKNVSRAATEYGRE